MGMVADFYPAFIVMFSGLMIIIISSKEYPSMWLIVMIAAELMAVGFMMGLDKLSEIYKQGEDEFIKTLGVH